MELDSNIIMKYSTFHNAKKYIDSRINIWKRRKIQEKLDLALFIKENEAQLLSRYLNYQGYATKLIPEGEWVRIIVEGL